MEKSRRRNKGLTKDINIMSTVINTLAPSLGKEGTKSIEDLKRKWILWSKRT